MSIVRSTNCAISLSLFQYAVQDCIIPMIINTTQDIPTGYKYILVWRQVRTRPAKSFCSLINLALRMKSGSYCATAKSKVPIFSLKPNSSLQLASFAVKTDLCLRPGLIAGNQIGSTKV